MESGLVFHVQKYSLQDGPGIRTTVFFKGCPLDCWWCHNPEGRLEVPEMTVVESRCIHCGQCQAACPQPSAMADSGGARTASSAAPEEAPATIHSCQTTSGDSLSGHQAPAVCSWCGACLEACPTGARQKAGELLSVPQVMDQVLKDRIFYDDSGGGVTFSGGEPFRQPEFLLALLRACREHELHTAIDTCGYAPTEWLLAAAPLTRLFLYDLKFLDPVRHTHYTGVSNELILENLRQLGQVHGNLWIRIPIIPGVNDDLPHLQALASFVASVPGVRQINLLPYHRIGIHKFRRFHLEYPLPNVLEPSPEQMQEVRRVFANPRIPIKIGG